MGTALSFVALSVILLSASSSLALPHPAARTAVPASLGLGVTSQLEVTSQTTTGSALTGMYVEVYTSLGTPLISGYTPADFTLPTGVTYEVSVSDYGGCLFAYWSDTGGQVDQRSVALAGDMLITAVFDCGSTTTSTTTTSTTATSSSPGTSTLAVGSEWANGTTITGQYAVLYQSGNAVQSGYTPVNFSLANGQAYQVEVDGYGSAYFQYWSDTNSVDTPRNVTISSSTSFDAVFCVGACSDGSTAPPPVDGVTVYADRIPASYWDPCFATACSAGTGPGASMYVVLEDSAGNVLHANYADEWGLTFTGLTPGVTYYVMATNCNLCHGSAHDVVFNYWTGGTLGTSHQTANPLAVTSGDVVEAWYSCTNSCAGGP